MSFDLDAAFLGEFLEDRLKEFEGRAVKHGSKLGGEGGKRSNLGDGALTNGLGNAGD